MGKWSGFWRLTGFERGLVVEALVALTATWLGLRLFGFRRWNCVLERVAAPSRAEIPYSKSGIVASGRAIARQESAAARNLFFHPSCLERSIVLRALLRSRAIPAELRIGAQKQAERFEAHAWVECEGIALNDANDVHVHFVPFDGPIISPETGSH
jgi:Transglutaminase-like superfamily